MSTILCIRAGENDPLIFLTGGSEPPPPPPELLPLSDAGCLYSEVSEVFL